MGTESKIVELVFEICNANVYLEREKKKKEELNHDVYFSSFSIFTFSSLSFSLQLQKLKVDTFYFFLSLLNYMFQQPA